MGEWMLNIANKLSQLQKLGEIICEKKKKKKSSLPCDEIITPVVLFQFRFDRELTLGLTVLFVTITKKHT